MRCQTTPLTLSVPATDISPNHYSQQITKILTKLSRNLSHHVKARRGNRTVRCTRGLNYHVAGVKGLPRWPVTHHFGAHGSRLPPPFPQIFPICLPHLSGFERKERVSRSLLGTGNYLWGPLGPILSGCTLTLSLNPLQQSQSNPHHWAWAVCFNQSTDTQ